MRAQRARRPLRSLERRRPGTWLSDRPEDEALTVALGVLCRIWRTPPTVHRFRLLAVEAARWADELPARWQLLPRINVVGRTWRSRRGK